MHFGFQQTLQICMHATYIRHCHCVLLYYFKAQTKSKKKRTSQTMNSLNQEVIMYMISIKNKHGERTSALCYTIQSNPFLFFLFFSDRDPIKSMRKQNLFLIRNVVAYIYYSYNNKVTKFYTYTIKESQPSSFS